MNNIFSTNFNYAARLRRIQQRMTEREIDCLLVVAHTNLYYISGFWPFIPYSGIGRPLIVLRDRDPILPIGAGAAYHAKEGTWLKDVRVIDELRPGLGALDYVAEVLKEEGVDAGTIGIEDEAMSYKEFLQYQRAFPKANLVDASDDILYYVRMVKDPEEIKIMKESVEIAEAGLQAAIDTAKVGVLESEVQKAAEIEMKRRGVIREVETMVQSGVRTACYQSLGANWKRINENEICLMDIGGIYKGYGADLTRTWVVGTPTEKQKKIANDLYKVQEDALDMTKPGVTCNEIGECIMSGLEKCGYPRRGRPVGTAIGYGMASIHGLGLGPFHDGPYTRWTGSVGGDAALEPGMVMSIQPSVRGEDFTMRFENNIVLTPTGYDLLDTKLPVKLI